LQLPANFSQYFLDDFASGILRFLEYSIKLGFARDRAIG